MYKSASPVGAADGGVEAPGVPLILLFYLSASGFLIDV
jgi:hypothetical protein